MYLEKPHCWRRNESLNIDLFIRRQEAAQWGSAFANALARQKPGPATWLACAHAERGREPCTVLIDQGDRSKGARQAVQLFGPAAARLRQGRGRSFKSA